MLRYTLALMVFAAACTPPAPVSLAHRSSINVQTRGVALLPDGDEGYAGMYGTTCGVDTSEGFTTSDVDLPTRKERVEDAGRNDQGPLVLATTRGGVHLIVGDPWQAEVIGLDRDRVFHGAITDRGVAVLQSDASAGCLVEFIDGEASQRVPVDRELCDDATGVTVARGDDVVMLGGADRTLVVGRDGVLWSTAPGQLVAWDESAEVFYSAERGSKVVDALEIDGATRWSRGLQGAVQSLDNLGNLQAAVVVTELADGAGSVVVLDAWSGKTRSDIDTPTAAKQVHVSANGKVLAMVLPDAVHFYNVREGDLTP